MGSIVVAHGLSCSIGRQTGMWDLPRPRLKLMSPALAGGFLTTVPPGKSHGEALAPLPRPVPGLLRAEESRPLGPLGRCAVDLLSRPTQPLGSGGTVPGPTTILLGAHEKKIVLIKRIKRKF